MQPWNYADSIMGFGSREVVPGSIVAWQQSEVQSSLGRAMEQLVAQFQMVANNLQALVSVVWKSHVGGGELETNFMNTRAIVDTNFEHVKTKVLDQEA